MGKYKTLVWKPFWKENYQSSWRENHIIGVLQEFGRDLRRCYERITRGYCDYDIFAIDSWFLGLMPTMLEDFRDNSYGTPPIPPSSDSMDSTTPISSKEVEEAGTETEQVGQHVNNCLSKEEWKAILNRMIFLLREAKEETCTRKNQYEEQYWEANREFEEKYGRFGEKLLTEEERKGPGRRVYTPRHVEEYKPISDLYFTEEKKLMEYREKCKDEAFVLFSKWFHALWD